MPSMSAMFIDALKQWNHERLQARHFARSCEVIPLRRSKAIERLVIIPGDPGTITDSRGDEAMVLCVIEHARALNPNVKIGIVCSTPRAEENTAKLGCTPIFAWHSRDPWQCLQVIETFDPDALWVLGADVIDGSYDAQDAIRSITLAQIYALRRTSAAILGFSFKNSPQTEVTEAIRRSPKRLKLKVRDRVSQHNLKNSTGKPGQLVADVAFGLKPAVNSPQLDELLAMMEAPRKAGKILVGVNVHPMLSMDGAPQDPEQLMRCMVDALLDRVNESLWFIPICHDEREPFGDRAVLTKLASAINARAPGRALHFVPTLNAREIKRLCESLDFVITGRMHLAIAALGSGTPALCIAYQQKFEGLLMHFNLPGDLAVPASLLNDPASMASRIAKAVAGKDAQQKSIRSRAKRVAKFSAKNFSG
jgi:colanic acid/amylovoran biosynthesis protein